MKTILAATDFSRSSLNAVRYAAALAVDTNARLQLFHATHLPVINDSYLDLGFTLNEITAHDKAKMLRLTNQLRLRYGETLKLDAHVEIGLAAELIRDKVNSREISLVVVGISAIGKAYELFFGSTSTDLAGELNCPVMIIPEKARYRPIKKLAFAFDQKEIPTTTGLSLLMKFKEHFETRIHFIHVLSDDFPEHDTSTLNSAFKLLGENNPSVRFLPPAKHHPENALEDWIRRYRMNVLVLVSRRHSLLWYFFHERTTKVLAFRSKIPLLVMSEKK